MSNKSPNRLKRKTQQNPFLKYLSWFSRGKRQSDVISASVGDKSKYVVVGKNIVQIGQLVFPLWLLVLLTTTLVCILGTIIRPSLSSFFDSMLKVRLSKPVPLTSHAGNNIQPSVSFQNDKIVFISDRAGNQEIYIMDLDGENQRRLTFTKNVFEDLPSFSPNGEKIIYGRNDGHDEEIYIMDIDGSNPINLSNLPTSNEGRPKFDRSGIIVFDSDQSGHFEIYTAEIKDNKLQNLMQQTHRQQRNSRLPSFSPHGDSIIFRSEVPGQLEETSGIYIVNLNNGSLRNISGMETFFYPSISPDGQEIIAVSGQSDAQNIYVFDIDGTRPREIVNDSFNNQFPIFSPNGQWIVFSSTRDGGNFDLFRIPYR